MTKLPGAILATVGCDAVQSEADECRAGLDGQVTSVEDRIAALIAENGPRNPDGSPAPWPDELLDWLRQTELNMRAEIGYRPDIPIGYTYDWLGNVLTFKNRDGYWYKITRGIHGGPLTYENRDGHWIKYIRDENGVFLDVESGQGTPPWEQT